MFSLLYSVEYLTVVCDDGFNIIAYGCLGYCEDSKEVHSLAIRLVECHIAEHCLTQELAWHFILEHFLTHVA